jgi:AN1-type zinc finger and ubiquitin domain-containing protein 1
MLSTSQTSPVPSQRCLIPIIIETLAGSSFELLVSPYEQIQYIKRKIERREGIPVSHQHLVWKTNELDDESCLHDYKIEAGTTIKLVLAMRGGPVNTKRVPIEDSFIRDMSEYIEGSRDDCTISNDLLPSSNKNVTFLVLRDGDQFNFFQVIDRGDGTLSPLSGSMRYIQNKIKKYLIIFDVFFFFFISNASMYNTHETTTVNPEREYNEKRQNDDRKTKQKMELIRSKLKTHARKVKNFDL